MVRICKRPVFILSAARTPIGRFDGALASHDAVELGATAIAAGVERAGVGPDLVEMVTMGMVVSCGYGEAPAKLAAIRSGLAPQVHSRVVDSVCGSAADAVALSSDAIELGAVNVAVAGGMESRSNAPYLLFARFRRSTANYSRGQRLRVKRAGAYRFALSENLEEQLSAAELVDPTAHDGLFWPPEKKFMREYAVQFAKKMGYSVELVNGCAAESHRRAREATEKGWFADEIAPVGDVRQDDLLPSEELARLRDECQDDPAGPYNSSFPADGAAAVLLASEDEARRGREPIARILGYSRTDGPPEEFLSAPVRAVKALTDALRDSGDDRPFEIIEANEAFAVQLPLFEESFRGVQMNLQGGAVALGHPFGAAGARLLTTLLHAMQRTGKHRGLVALCFGGGGAYALAVERES